MRFCTAINCMDGRTQVPVIEYLKNRFEVEYVDVITEAGVNRVLAEGSDEALMASIRHRLAISVERHFSVGVAVAGHHDCAGNPTTSDEQKQHIRQAIERVRQMSGGLPVIGLWVDANWQVTEVS